MQPLELGRDLHLTDGRLAAHAGQQAAHRAAHVAYRQLKIGASMR